MSDSTMSRGHAEKSLAALEDFMVTGGYSPQTIVQRMTLLRGMSVDPVLATQADLLAAIPANVTNGTRRTYATGLRGAMRDLVTMGLRLDNPLENVRVNAPQSRKPDPLPTEVLELLLVQKPCEELHWTRLGALAGLRAAETSYARPSDVRDGGQGPVLEVLGKGGKVGLIPAHPLVVESIGAASWRVTPGGLSTRWASWARKITGHTYRFHQLRHSYGTRMYLATRDPLLVRDLMRHANVRSTEAYVQPDTSAMWEAILGQA